MIYWWMVWSGLLMNFSNYSLWLFSWFMIYFLYISLISILLCNSFIHSFLRHSSVALQLRGFAFETQVPMLWSRYYRTIFILVVCLCCENLLCSTFSCCILMSCAHLGFHKSYINDFSYHRVVVIMDVNTWQAEFQWFLVQQAETLLLEWVVELLMSSIGLLLTLLNWTLIIGPMDQNWKNEEPLFSKPCLFL